MLSLKNRTTELAIEAANTPTDCRGINSKKHRDSGKIASIRYSDEILQFQRFY